MYELEETTTVTIKPCWSCGVGMIEESKFCRSCGARQTGTLLPYSQVTLSVANAEILATPYTTARLSEKRFYHPVSGPLVSAVVAGVPATLPHSPAGSFSKRMLLALMAVPIWIMIILLSPLDAYASAKIIGSRI